ncbi:MAG TPA: response regulator, partial [Solirubrobacteraceae bacterium]|nr:response regulator [Solirubrobacteraceae bacterium]
MQAAAGERAEETRAPEEEQPAGSRGPARVLVVEDEPGIVDFVRRGLEAEGFAVESALDGIEGERLALAGDFDAVMLDLMLPGQSGLEV